MNKEVKLTEGNITSALVKLALPIMATSFVEMAYNFMDMIWLGRLSTEAVAAAGTVGFFTWFGSALFLVPKIGVEVGVAQSYGRDDMKAAKSYVSHALQIDIVIALIYSLLLILFKDKLIGFFNLGNNEVINMAVDYLVIVSFGMIFYFLNPVFAGIFNGAGNSITPFIINSIGLGINIILDPILIFGWGPFPKMGIKGAAWATVIAQFIATLIFLKINSEKLVLFTNLNLFEIPDKKYIKKIFKLGFPAALQTGAFASIAMIIAKIIAQWGPTPIAVQKVGSQIESISWMTAGGFSTALSAFVGQNYGARKKARIHKGYVRGITIIGTIGIFATLLLIFAAEPIFKLFIPEDEEAIRQGVTYLRILGVSQFFMSIEIATGGAFNGLGRTLPPAIVGIVFNALRIPASLILSSKTSLGLNGVWWSISISSVFKGIVMTIWFTILLKKNLIFNGSIEEGEGNV